MFPLLFSQILYLLKNKTFSLFLILFHSLQIMITVILSSFPFYEMWFYNAALYCLSLFLIFQRFLFHSLCFNYYFQWSYFFWSYLFGDSCTFNFLKIIYMGVSFLSLGKLFGCLCALIYFLKKLSIWVFLSLFQGIFLLFYCLGFDLCH